jgi:excisionase family DNA binding protein
MVLSVEQTKNQNKDYKTWDNLLTRRDAAKLLNLKISTLEAWATRGGGPAYVKLGRAVRYRESDLVKFVESQVRQNTSTSEA